MTSHNDAEIMFASSPVDVKLDDLAAHVIANMQHVSSSRIGPDLNIGKDILLAPTLITEDVECMTGEDIAYRLEIGMYIAGTVPVNRYIGVDNGMMYGTTFGGNWLASNMGPSLFDRVVEELKKFFQRFEQAFALFDREYSETMTVDEQAKLFASKIESVMWAGENAIAIIERR